MVAEKAGWLLILRSFLSRRGINVLVAGGLVLWGMWMEGWAVNRQGGSEDGCFLAEMRGRGMSVE